MNKLNSSTVTEELNGNRSAWWLMNDILRMEAVNVNVEVLISICPMKRVNYKEETLPIF